MAEALSSSIECLGNIPNTTAVYHHPHHHHRRDFSLLPVKSSHRSSFPLFNLRSSPSSSPNWMVFSRGKRPIPHQSRPKVSISAQLSTGTGAGIGIGKAHRWWEKGLQPNMKEVKDADDLVDSLVNAGDHLVVVHFFSPGCGGCKALHPKICQLAEMNPDVQFLEVNYETHKSMCYTLNVHVLPFFRFYRGGHGRLCSFSCTNATIKKFRGALAKYGADFCSLEPTKGLEEKELLALAANKDLSFNYTPKPEPEPEPPVVAPEQEEVLSEEITAQSERTRPHPHPLPLPLPLPSITALHSEQDTEKRTLISSGR